MQRMEECRAASVQRTKENIVDDISSFMEPLDQQPELHAYIAARGEYISQLWLNVWLNKASNDLPRKIKKEFLESKGYETQDVDKRTINQLFRSEIRDLRPFDGVAWVTEEYASQPEKWASLYRLAREDFKAKEEALKRQQERQKLKKKLAGLMEDMVTGHFPRFYVHARYYIAGLIKKDVADSPRFSYARNPRYKDSLIEDGRFDVDDYETAGDFFEEMTGAIAYGTGYHFEYESYGDYYFGQVYEYLQTIAADFLSEYVPPGLFQEDSVDWKFEFKADEVASLIHEQLEELARMVMEELEEEYIEDLFRLPSYPFDEKEQLNLLENDCARADARREQELAEQKRREEEERKLIDEVFGQAYVPNISPATKYVLHIGETNTGKTYRALKRMRQGETGIYLAPLRLLALEVFDKLNAEGVPCTLKTGEEEKRVPGARHMSSTVEMFREKDRYDVVVIDEAQMLSDKDRGYAWYKAITHANAREVHIIGSLNIKSLLLKLLDGGDVEIFEYTREVPLSVETQPFELKRATKGDALICFSRKRVLETAARLRRSGYAVSMIYGSMPPETRKKQIEQFNRGETSIVVATDAIGMGLNLPIRRIVFLENEKFDGNSRRTLTSQEVKQIAGRAGRKGIYETGFVAFMSGIERMTRLLEKQDEAVSSFSIAPSSAIFEKFQKYSRSLEDFFLFWDRFEPPGGTKKAALAEEKELYELIKGTPIEEKFSMIDLYGFLHLPFSSKEPILVRQWLETMFAIYEGRELPDPVIKNKGLDDTEVSYKAIGLHLLFLYKLGRQTEAVYWERVREELSDEVHEHLKEEVGHSRNKCKRCGKELPELAKYPICDACYHGNKRNRGMRRGKMRR